MERVRFILCAFLHFKLLSFFLSAYTQQCIYFTIEKTPIPRTMSECLTLTCQCQSVICAYIPRPVPPRPSDKRASSGGSNNGSDNSKR
ncbi:hypothetical protein B0T20DRAFT_244668 [Sordaria brevicollis]|uniref:Secreted protein n=1 Tax=Sordaria brevicollis TaxID=83679 RepID=A0AAE0PC57_SORBR|nr:hypothetical protein B0T20DRAFT_244668 [Sordaria brevicollis]